MSETREVPLDINESTFLDVIIYKELAARRAVDLAKKELAECDTLKKNLLGRLGQRAKVTNGQSISIDFDRKVAIVTGEKPSELVKTLG